jgi:Helix-hairpin-helix containing domain
LRDAYGADAARLVRENPHRLADDIHGIGIVTADSLRVMLGIGPTSPFRMHAALKYVLSLVARTEGHVYSGPIGRLREQTEDARQILGEGVARWREVGISAGIVRCLAGLANGGQYGVRPNRRIRTRADRRPTCVPNSSTQASARRGPPVRPSRWTKRERRRQAQ